MGDGQQITNKAKNLIIYRKKKALVKYILQKLKEVGKNLEEFCEFFRELMREDASFIVNQVYDEFRVSASKFLSFDELMNIDERIMKNYVISEREQYITSFKGSVELIGVFFEGFLILTNLRLAGIGTVKRSPSDKFDYWGAYALGGLIGATIANEVIKDRKQKGESIQWALKRDLGNLFSDKVLDKFDYNFPIIRAYDIKRTIKSLSYNIKLKYEHEFGLKTVRILIRPLQEKNEKKSDFLTRIEDILAKVEETIYKTLLLDDYEIEKPPDKVFLMRTSITIDENGVEIIQKICAYCGDKDNFTKTAGNIFKCLRCGATHYIRD
ncbi:MAG: hypothetical protein ACFFEN_10530 [Candidatus Thorarchaeota archaeon]